MKRTTLLGLGLLAAAIGGATFACSSSDSGGSGGGGGVVSGGGTGNVDGAAATGGGGTGGGGTGGTGGGTVRVGRACQTDAECGQGLTCLKVTSTDLDGEGPGKGYCTTDCSADETVCAQFDSKGVCLQYDNGKAYCVEGCTFGPDDLEAFDPKKCHGRQEVACRPLYDETGNFTVAACLPQCNSDADCGGGLKCNARTGGCTATAPTGKPLGSTCVQQDGGASECKGNCTGIVHSSTDAEPFTYVCTEACTVGAVPACGWGGPGTGKAPGYCLFFTSAVFDNGGPGLGDFGSCGQLCNCNSDCLNSDFVCTAWTGANAAQLVSAFGQQGYCGDPKLDDGGNDPGIPTCGTAGTGGTGGTDGGGTGGTGGATDAGTD